MRIKIPRLTPDVQRGGGEGEEEVISLFKDTPQVERKKTMIDKKRECVCMCVCVHASKN